MAILRSDAQKPLLCWLAAIVLVASAAAPSRATVVQSEDRDRPQAGEPSGPSPSRILADRQNQEPPSLTRGGRTSGESVNAFIDWAANSTIEQEDEVRRILATAAGDREIVESFCDVALTSRTSDHSRALVALALLGEMRSALGEGCLHRFIELPLPERGTVVEGEIVERTALETLQAKAIDGLAYLRSTSADQVVLDAVAKHPSRIVRAEAIAAYLWNRQYSRDARETLRRSVRPEEEIFLDRIVREPGESSDTFNRKLGGFLIAHPELVPPPPEQEREEADPAESADPPTF